MNTLRVTLALAAFAALASAQALTTIYFGDASGNALTTLAAPAVGSNFTLSVWLTSTVAINDGEVLVALDQATSIGPSATPTLGLVSLGGATATASVAAASGFAATTVTAAGGGVGSGTGNGAGTRGYGLDIASIARTDLANYGAAAPTLLFTMTLKNQGITAGKSQAISFYESASARYRTSLVAGDGTFADVVPSVGSITVAAAPVPEPGTFAALGVAALAVLRRRKRA